MRWLSELSLLRTHLQLSVALSMSDSALWVGLRMCEIQGIKRRQLSPVTAWGITLREELLSSVVRFDTWSFVRGTGHASLEKTFVSVASSFNLSAPIWMHSFCSYCCPICWFFVNGCIHFCETFKCWFTHVVTHINKDFLGTRAPNIVSVYFLYTFFRYCDIIRKQFVTLSLGEWLFEILH